MQNQNFHVKVWRLSLENTATWKMKSSISSLDLCAPTKLIQITVLESTKMRQKSSMADRVHKNGPTVKNVKRCQPVQNACAVTKFMQLRHFISNLKQDSPGIQLFWKFLPWNLIVQEIVSQKSFSQKFLRNHFLVSTFLK